MKQTITVQGNPISVELLDPCCAPTPDLRAELSDAECREVIEQVGKLEQHLLQNRELSWQVIGYRVCEVFQRDYNQWDITLSKGKQHVKCWLKMGRQKSETSLHWAFVQQSW